MPGVVALTSLRPDLGLESQVGGLGVMDIRHPEAAEQLLGRWSDEPVLVLCTQADLDNARSVVALAATRFPSLRASVEALPGPSLTLAEFGRRAAAQPDLVSSVAALDSLREAAWIAAWLPQVRKLATVSPSMGQHLRSYLPGAGFLVEFAPDPHVTTLTGPRAQGRAKQSQPRRAKSRGAEPADFSGHTLVHSSTDISWLVDDVRRSLNLGAAERGEPLHDVVDAHGSSRVVEFVTVRPDLESDIHRRLSHAVECAACGAHHPRSVCPWCGMTTDQPLLATPDQGATW